LKVGKKKPVADNATSTSFKAQAIVLPGQSVTADRSQQATNSRNQTLGSLTAQLKHYSASTRRDALHGLAELFRIHPYLLATSLGQLVNLLATLLVDEDNQVRRSLYQFLDDFLPTLSKADLAPFLPVLVVYTRSAMTHLNEAVQAGSLQFLDLWLRLAPAFVVAQQAQLMPNYIGLLNGNQGQSSLSGKPSAGGSVRNSVFINPKSMVGSQKLRIDVLGSLYRFLEASTAIKTAAIVDDRYWFFRNYLSQPIAPDWIHENMKSLLQHFTVYFPYGQDVPGLLDKKDMNATFCELISFYLLVQEHNLHRNTKTDSVVPPWASQVVDYILEAFNWRANSTTAKGRGNDMVNVMDAEQLAAIMPSVWTLLNCLEPTEQGILFQYQGVFKIRPRSVEAMALRRWLLSLPKMLWNLKLAHPETTQIVLEALTDAANKLGLASMGLSQEVFRTALLDMGGIDTGHLGEEGGGGGERGSENGNSGQLHGDYYYGWKQ
ncbi:Rix1 complex component, partial [Syncephalis pseudoplumigaleata]